MFSFKTLVNLLSLFWVSESDKNCFGATKSDNDGTYDHERVWMDFKQSILADWYNHILMDGYGKVVHTFTVNNRWFMVNVKFDVETSKFYVTTKTSGGNLTEEEERLLDFFEWYLSTTLTANRDVDYVSGNPTKVEVFTRRNETWCCGKNNLLSSN